jgi:catechol 2,3-dioxygenase-like lactoylglutathione lyase family enzyme
MAAGTTGAGTTAAVAFADPGFAGDGAGGTGDTGASAEPVGARATHTGVATEDTPPMVVRLPSSPVRGGARRRPSPRPRPGTHDRAPARPVPAAAPEETPAVVTEAAATTYTIPEAGSTLSPPPDLPVSDVPVTEPPAAVTMTKPAGATSTSTSTSTSTDSSAGSSAGSVGAGASQDVEGEVVDVPTPAAAAETMVAGHTVSEPTVAGPAAGAAAAEPAAGPLESAVEGGADLPGDRPAGTAALASGITWWPDREMEQLPTRAPRIDRTTVRDETTADTTADTTGDTTADTTAGNGTGPGTTAVPPAVIPPTPLRSANEASYAGNGTGARDRTGERSGAGTNERSGAGTGESSGDAADADEAGRTTSAWSSGNGRGASPSGTGMFGAPPVWPKPADVDDDDEPAAPNPYATEHYVGDSPEDQLEEQPPSEGAVGQFLAAQQRQESMPLDGVNGVSITLIVSDLERSRRFYRDTLGLTELDSGDAAAVLATGDARVVLRRVADMPPVDRRVVHLNLEVPDVYEAYERLREQGVDFVHRPRVVPQGEQLELCSATFRDPDGHAIALTKWELRR